LRSDYTNPESVATPTGVENRHPGEIASSNGSLVLEKVRHRTTISELVQKSRLATFSAVYMIALLVAIFTALEGSLFWSSPTLRSILSSTGIEGMLALGVLVPFVVGTLDFSSPMSRGRGWS
jgi:hypothetical protein